MGVRPRILVVDDEPVVRESLRDWFTNGGFPVDMAADAREALQKLQESSWDILLTDVKMPGMDGLELQQRAKQIDPDITVIIMTAYASVDSAMLAIKEGAYDYVTKPLDPEDLEQIINRASERRLLVRENLHLKNVLERAAVQQQGEEILPQDLPLEPAEAAQPVSGMSLAEVEKRHIQSVLAETSGNISRAAQALQVDESALDEKIREYGLDASRQ